MTSSPDIEALVGRLNAYTSLNEWGDPVEHSICEEARDALTTLQAQVEELSRENARLGERNTDVSMLAHKWMVAHDMRAAGKPYDYPEPADLPNAIARAEEAEAQVEELRRERDEARRRAAPVALGQPARRAAAKKLLCDICACAAETDPESLDLPHVISDCVEPLETLIAERDACLFLSQEAHKYAGRDGHDIFDAIAEKHAALARAEALQRERDALKGEVRELGASRDHALTTCSALECSAGESVLLDLTESLQEGLMTDAGLSTEDRKAMKWQLTALFEALDMVREREASSAKQVDSDQSRDDLNPSPRPSREAVAREIAEGLGYDFDTLYENKSEWTQDHGSRHDINTPYKPDFLEAADRMRALFALPGGEGKQEVMASSAERRVSASRRTEGSGS